MRFVINESERLAACIRHLADLPTHKSWLVDIKEYQPSRSTSQNALYWMWLGVIAEYMGEDKNDLHERFATKFIGIEEKEVKYLDEEQKIQRVTLRRPKSTTSLTTKEFTDYLEKIEITIKTAFPDFILPYPDDYRYAMMK